MQIRDRIKSFRRVPAAKLKANPKNFRKHGQAQRSALRGALAEIGLADAVIARELDDGTLELIDGHLRLEEVPEETKVPTLIVDVTAEEADTLLATLDPIAAMAEVNQDALNELLGGLQPQDGDLTAFLDRLAQDAGEALATEETTVTADKAFKVVVQCPDPEAQAALFARLVEEGYQCRRVTRRVRSTA